MGNSLTARKRPQRVPLTTVKAVSGKAVAWFIMILFAVFSVIPMLWLILAPSKTQVELQRSAPLSFGSFQGYSDAWNNLMVFQDGRIVDWIINSIWYTGVQVLVACTIAILAGYALSATRLPLRKTMLIATLVAMIVPQVAFVLPLFVEISALGIYNTAWAIILPGTFYPFGVFLSYIYFSTTIPSELYEAAKIDGCGDWGTFFRVAVPLSGGLIGMLAFFSFQVNWINFFLPFVVVSSGDVLTLPVGLGILFSSTPALSPQVGANALPIRAPEIALAGMLVAIPILIVFLFSARLLVRGVLAGSVKG